MSDTINVFIGGTSAALLESIMSKLDDIKDDLTQTKSDLDAIKMAVTARTTELQAKVAELQATITTLQAGDALEQQQIDALVGQAESVKVAADDTLATVQPSA